MEGYTNQGENSSRHVLQLFPLEPHHSDSETEPHINNTARVAEWRARPSPSCRPRGRPPGSKNKPKPPIIISQDIPSVIQPHVLNVSVGTDIMESLNNYTRQRGIGVFVFNGCGKVSNVTISQPTSTSTSVVTLNGAFDIFSITGMVLPPSALPGTGGLSILLSGGQGQILGGNVLGPLIATCTVVLMVASFSNIIFACLPLVDEEAVTQEDTSGGSSQVQKVQPRPLDAANLAS